MAIFKSNVENVKKLLLAAIPRIAAKEWGDITKERQVNLMCLLALLYKGITLELRELIVTIFRVIFTMWKISFKCKKTLK